jgi:hypothetical protein
MIDKADIKISPAEALKKQTEPMNPRIGPTDAKIAASKGSKIQGGKR